MARYDPPVPALFATVHRYPEDEVERMNRSLADDYSDRALIHETALQLLRRAQPWPEKRADQLRGGRRQGWQPRGVAEHLAPWTARREAFVWRGKDCDETSTAFAGFARDLSSADQFVRLDAAKRIFRWGGIFRAVPTDQEVDLVVAASRATSAGPNVPWSSGWTKVAAAATHLNDLEREAIGRPQIIWDSRVSFAVAELITPSTETIRDRLFLVHGRTKRRTADSPRAQKLKAAGWRSSVTRERKWTGQFWGSRVVHAMSGILNSSDEFGDERQHHARWTAFDVAAALFVEGY